MLGRCLSGRGRRGNSAARLLGPSPTFQRTLSCGSFSTVATPTVIVGPLSQPRLACAVRSLAHTVLHLPQVLPTCPAACLHASYWSGESFFNSLVVRVPCNLIFWHVWLFIDFRLLLSSFWLCEEAKGFFLHLHLGPNCCCCIFFKWTLDEQKFLILVLLDLSAFKKWLVLLIKETFLFSMFKFSHMLSQF